MEVKNINYLTSNKGTSIRCEFGEDKLWWTVLIIVFSNGKIDGTLMYKSKQQPIPNSKTKKILRKVCDKRPKLNNIIAKELI